MTPQLVNWSPGDKKFIGSWPSADRTEFLRLLKTERRPKEIEELVSALTMMWTRIGAAANCGKCFQGKLKGNSGRRGCCGICPNLGDTGCVAKPIGCALYTCGVVHFEDLKHGSYLHGQVQMLRHTAYELGIGQQFFSHGYFEECKTKWTPEQLQGVKVLTRLANNVYGYGY